MIKIKTVTSSSVQSTKSGKSSLSSLSLIFAVVLGMPGSKIAKKLANLTQINFMESSALQTLIFFPKILAKVTFFVPVDFARITGHLTVD